MIAHTTVNRIGTTSANSMIADPFCRRLNRRKALNSDILTSPSVPPPATSPLPMHRPPAPRRTAIGHVAKADLPSVATEAPATAMKPRALGAVPLPPVDVLEEGKRRPALPRPPLRPAPRATSPQDRAKCPPRKRI